MNKDKVKEIYFLATGIEISDETAIILLDAEQSPWFQKVIKLAEPNPFSKLNNSEQYTEVPA